MKAYYLFIKDLNLDLTHFLDPLSVSILSVLSEYGINNFSAFLLLQFSVYIFLLSKIILDQNYLRSILNASIISSIIYFLGFRLISLLFLTPTLEIYLFYKLLQKFTLEKKLLFKLVSVIFIIHGIISAGPFSVLSLLLVYLTESEDKIFDRKILFQILFFFLAFFVSTYPNYNTSFLDYPIDAQVTENSPLTYFGSTNFGLERQPFPIPYGAFKNEKNIIGLSYLITLFPVFAFVIINRFKKNNLISISQKAFFVSYLLLLFNYLMNERGSIIILDSAIIKSLPGLTWRPSPNLIGMISLFLGLFKLIKNKTINYLLASFCLCLINFYFLSSIKNQDVFHITYDNLPKQISDIENQTPSNYVLEYFRSALGITSIRKNTFLTKDLKLNSSNCKIQSNIDKNIEFLLDNNEKTKWSTKGPQKSGDYLDIICDQEVVGSRLKFSINNYQTDFPRGFDLIINDNLKYSFPKWIGSLKFTGNGLAYFGHQGDVTIDFPEKMTFKKLKIILTGNDKIYDWSVGEIESYN